jgi:cell wall-associated NlpC family hydrolase
VPHSTLSTARVADSNADRGPIALRTAVRAAIVAASTAAAALVAALPATSSAEVAPAISVAGAATTPATAVMTFDRPAAAPVAARPAVTASVAPVAVRAPMAAGRSSAMQKALGKLGAGYRWGATGPSSFDCSGLVFWSYRQIGVTLPRTSRAMSSVGTPVTKGNLQPGDLVFFYRPVSHVAIYIGNGKVVHASTAGSPVKISSLSTMPFATARRI